MFLGRRLPLSAARRLALLALFAWWHSARAADTTTPAPPFPLLDGDRVLFMGDTFLEREVDYGHIETRLTAAFPDRNVTFRNLSWAGDTPMGRARASFDWNKSDDDWLKRVKEQVALVKPTVAFLSYGMTAALEAAEAKTLEEQRAIIAKFQTDLGRLMDAIDEVSGQKARFVLVGPLPRLPANSGEHPEVRETNRSLFAVQTATRELAEARKQFFVGFGVLGNVGSWDINPDAPAPTADGVAPNRRGNDSAAQQIVRALNGGSLSVGPQQAEDLLNSAIRKKNELFFHRWRPANWTYIFGFRKGEQGRNAVEIPMFDPLIAEWDARIAKLRDLKHQDPAAVTEVRSLLSSEKAREHRDPNYREQPVPTFDVAPGFAVSLWAENPMLYKPIQMNWDPRGRLWVASSRLYPMIKPGQEAEDAVIVLEDTDGDGKADKHTVFAEGLVIPTGVVPDGKGGCYVAASHQLLHFADTDGDGRADRRTIVLSSFGTEDTHHNLHTLRWGFDGHLYMNQSIYTHSHVETPHGVRRLNSGGIWRFQPDTHALEVFTRGGCNPWGHHWDQYGNSFFTDGAGFKGVYHAMEGATYFTYSDMRREAESISPGNYPKFAGIELVHSPAFPADWQGDVITCDFRAHRVVRFKLAEVGSTWQTREQPDLLRSTHVTFRPIDLRFGPDGALYVADWSNPIIQHGEVDFRDPRRDHEHGRVWRVVPAATDRPAKPADLTRLGDEALLARTLSRNGWEQEQARVVLRQRPAQQVLTATRKWLENRADPRARLEAAWLHNAFGAAAPALVGELAAARDERLRTAAARQLAR